MAATTASSANFKNYILVTLAYWGFTITDGALRMLVLLYFNNIGYTPIQIASLFLFYEIFGVVTNFLGGWIGSQFGLKVTLYGGIGLQVFALVMLSFLNPAWTQWVAVGYVMVAQAFSGIAKDLTKMSSKSAIRLVVPQEAQSSLFKWVAVLTGSKNALKGVGFFVGAALLASVGFVGALTPHGRRVVPAALYRLVSAQRDGQNQGEDQVYAALFQKPGNQHSLGGSVLSLRFPRCLVCGRPTRFP